MMIEAMGKSKSCIELGEVIVHGDAELAVQRAHQKVEEFLERFRLGDFGDVDAETRQFNEQALKEQGDVLAIYELCSGLPLFIVGDGKRTEVVVL